MLRRFGFLNKRRGEVGLEVGSAHLALACSKMTPAGMRIVRTVNQVCLAAQRPGLLASWVAELGLQKHDCHLVLTPDAYQVIQLERPAVPESELREAARWRVKDMLEYAVDDAVIDCFAVPEDALRGRMAQVSVVCARKSILLELNQLVESSGLYLKSVDITELAVRNLLLDRDGNAGMKCVLLLTAEGGLILLLKQNSVYLSRKLEKGRFKLGPDMDVYSGSQLIALEIQRSFDYLESQLAQAPPGTIHLAADFFEAELAERLAEELGVGVASLSDFGLQAEVQRHISAHEWVACGAALRRNLAT